MVVRRAVSHDVAYERVGVAGHRVCEPKEGITWFRMSEPEDALLV